MEFSLLVALADVGAEVDHGRLVLGRPEFGEEFDGLRKVTAHDADGRSDAVLVLDDALEILHGGGVLVTADEPCDDLGQPSHPPKCRIRATLSRMAPTARAPDEALTPIRLAVFLWTMSR